ncbi:hypothetical protein MKW92_052809 [Papaver armeniacum]|nr:hypothetical protein MKW92_052809 [Papaver armeniacum]
MFIQQILLIQFCFCLMLATSLDAFGETKPGCPDKCGNVSIPYPFGISSIGCSIREVGYGYNINCDSSYDPPKPFIGLTSLQVLSISETEIRVSNKVSKVCFNGLGRVVLNHSIVETSVQRTPFTISNTNNRYFLIGCQSIAAYRGIDQENMVYLSACVSTCYSREKVVEGSCDGNGCCQTTISKGITNFQTAILSTNNSTNFLSYSPCTYAFVGEYGQFNFSASDLLDVPEDIDIPLVLDWAIGNNTCEEAQKYPTTYACQVNSHCKNSDNNPGYRCTCFEGYKGNPYLSPGCKAGSKGDGRKDGRGCTRKVPIIQLTLGKVFPVNDNSIRAQHTFQWFLCFNSLFCIQSYTMQ